MRRLKELLRARETYGSPFPQGFLARTEIPGRDRRFAPPPMLRLRARACCGFPCAQRARRLCSRPVISPVPSHTVVAPFFVGPPESVNSCWLQARCRQCLEGAATLGLIPDASWGGWHREVFTYVVVRRLSCANATPVGPPCPSIKTKIKSKNGEGSAAKAREWPAAAARQADRA